MILRLLYAICYNIFWGVLTVKYIFYDDKIIISAFNGLKKISINFEDINGLVVREKYIDGFKLSGIGKNRFAFGRMVVDGIGSTRAFITSSKRVIYIHTENQSFAISPKYTDDVLTILFDKNIPLKEFKTKINSNRELFKSGSFLVPFIGTTIVISLMIIVPFIMYLLGAIPKDMPLTFDATFNAVTMGSGKEFAIKQMVIGICNIIILICMYYTSYFTARYDKRLAARYMYIALIISFLFEFIQIQVLISYL